MKPIRAFNFKASKDFSNIVSELPISLAEHLLLDEIRDKIITPLVHNVGREIYNLIYNKED